MRVEWLWFHVLSSQTFASLNSRLRGVPASRGIDSGVYSSRSRSKNEEYTRHHESRRCVMPSLFRAESIPSTTRAKDAQGTLTQSHESPSILVHDGNQLRTIDRHDHSSEKHCNTWGRGTSHLLLVLPPPLPPSRPPHYKPHPHPRAPCPPAPHNLFTI